ncbi:peptide chain release factor-like protein [Candidatus Desantisbacteria bacterium]|nr:peptide chain release factor-like protein [Candidatus Desantisbacteria bacterium]
MSLFSVSSAKEQYLKKRMEELGIFEKDIVEKFIRSQGKGGQNVNKTSTCVHLEHIPTGIKVKMQRERVQSLNRFLARRLLIEKIENNFFKEKSEKQQLIEKIRRQKRKKSKRAKEKILRDKKIQSIKKESRKTVSSNDGD